MVRTDLDLANASSAPSSKEQSLNVTNSFFLSRASVFIMDAVMV